MMFYQSILSFSNFDAYILIFIDFMFKVETHVQQFENICKP
jgi:hypothetical protein